jgi:hypothetical protein
MGRWAGRHCAYPSGFLLRAIGDFLHTSQTMTSLRLDVGKMILVLCDRIRYERVSQILWTAEATLQQSITPAYRSGTSSFQPRSDTTLGWETCVQSHTGYLVLPDRIGIRVPPKHSAKAGTSEIYPAIRDHVRAIMGSTQVIQES